MMPPDAVAAGFPRTGREIAMQAPISEEQIRSLKVGDVVLVSGLMYTGRDAVHAHLMKNAPPVDLRGSVLYHCGPVVMRDGQSWKVTAAGPTTSIREEPYQAEILRTYGVRVVVGKGGMGAKTLAGLQEFGTPEAMWHLRVRDFPAIVTMDAHGNSLHKQVEDASGEVLGTLR
jgi:fumarate hydratase class I